MIINYDTLTGMIIIYVLSEIPKHKQTSDSLYLDIIDYQVTVLPDKKYPYFCLLVVISQKRAGLAIPIFIMEL